MPDGEKPNLTDLTKRPLGSWARPAGIALALGIVGSVGARQVGLPLPNLLGPLFLCAIATLAGLELSPLPWTRELGQVVVGMATGLRLLPEVLHAVLALLPVMLVATFGVVAVTMTSGLILRALCGVDRPTAFFGTAPVGLAEMASIAHARGGAADIVSLTHTVRVSATVTIVPLLVTWFGKDGGIIQHQVPGEGHVLELAALIGTAIVGAVLLRRMRVPNTWLLTAILVGSVAAGSGLSSVTMPPLLMIVAQLMIGIWLGCRFRRALLLKLPRITLGACLTTVLLLLATAVGASLLSTFTELSYATSFLALAPAGVTEMVLTASLLHLDVAVITAFHVMRILLVTASIMFLFQVFNFVSKWVDGSRA
jgi:uncharacterized protein